MVKILEELTLEEASTIMVALKEEMLACKAMLHQDDDSFYKKRIENIYSIFHKLGFSFKEADRFINS